jgi:hypothetical protein
LSQDAKKPGDTGGGETSGGTLGKLFGPLMADGLPRPVLLAGLLVLASVALMVALPALVL